MKSSDWHKVTAIIGFAAVYFCAGKLGLSLAYLHPSVSAFWPPSGIALAALLLWGYRLWPGVFLGAFLVNITTFGSFATTLGIATGNTLEALLGAWAINRFANGARVFERARNVFKFALLAPAVSTAASATFGVTSLMLGGFAEWSRYAAVWLTWWLGDAVGDLIIAPLPLIWLTLPRPDWKLNRVVEATALLMATVLVTYLMFLLDTPVSSEYMIILPLLWAAFRFGQRGAVTSAFIISLIALAGTVRGGGPFVHPDPNDSLLHLQAFMGTIAVAALLLSSAISEVNRAEQRLQVQDAVSRTLAEASNLREAAGQIIQALCTRTGWDVGAVWHVDRQHNEMTCVKVWQTHSIISAQPFAALTKQLCLAHGEDLPGRVWRTGEPAWITDVATDDNFLRAAVAGTSGIHSGVGFPIKLSDVILGAIECFSQEVREPDGNFLQMVGDIGAQLGQFVERKRSEELLLDREKRLRAVVETTVDGILTIDAQGIIDTVNPAAERLFGYTAVEMIGANARMLMPEVSRSTHGSFFDNYSRTNGNLTDISREVQGQRKDGSLFPIELALSETRIGNRRLFTGTVRDMTERKQAENLLRQAKDDLTKANEELEARVQERTADLEKANAALRRTLEERQRLEEKLGHAQMMESIGTLAGGIAHDFNNLLNIIRGYATWIGQQPSAGWQIKESLKVIDHEIERGAAVVRQLLTVARKTETHLMPTDLNDVVSTLTELIKTFPKTVTVSLDLAPQLPPVLADPNQLSRALLNVCVNARDAMPGGGKLTIRTSVADADQGAGRAIGASVCIAISDTGGGIDEDLRERIFEPFFTTKGVGEGTGLGLAIVYGIVKEHNGAIDVQSVPNQGTTFRIFLPIPDFGSISVSLDSSHRQSSTPPPPRRGGTVLVVEDERSLIRLLDTLLPQAGYRVLAATDGEQAIELYQRHKAVIDVVLLDLGLPKITGLDVIPKLKEQNSNVSIVIATGYLEPRLKEELMRVGVKDCISKPYAVKDVIERLDSVIQTCRTAVPPVA